MIPDQIKFFGHTIRIIKDDKRQEDDQSWGSACHAAFEIRLAASANGYEISEGKRKETLLHELIHFVSDTWLGEKEELNETQVKVIARALYAVITDNNLDFREAGG